MRDAFWDSEGPALPPSGPPLGSQLAADPSAAYVPPSTFDPVRELIAVIIRGKWVILGLLVLVMGTVVVYNQVVAPQYEAYSLLFVDTRATSGGVGDMLDVGRSGGMFTGASTRFIANEVTNLRQSQLLAEVVADELLLFGDVPNTDEPLTILYNHEGEPLPRHAIADRLQRQYLEVIPEGEGLDFIRIVARSTVPGEAALLANRYAEAFVRQTRQSSRERLSASRAFLEEQGDKLSVELRRLENEVSTYKSQQGAVALDAEANRTVEQLAQLESMRDQTRISMQMKQASLGSLEEELRRIEPRLVERIASRVEIDIEEAQARIAELELERKQIYRVNPELRETGRSVPGLDAINDEIEELNQSVERLSQQYVNEVLAVGGINLSIDGEGLSRIADLNRQVVDERIAISGLEAEEDVLNRRMREYNVKLTNIPEQAVRLAGMERSRLATERMYLFIVEKLNETRVAEESELGYAEITRWARPPGSPVHPRKTQNLVMGLLFGLLLGFGAALLRYKLDTRIHRPESLKARGLSVLGVVPDFEDTLREEFAGKTTIELEGRSISTSLLALIQPLSPIVETFRQIRTNIQFSRPDKVIQTLLVTSAEIGAGKSTSAANLAVVMAQAGRKTLLLEADLRRPRVHTILGLTREPGLTELLFGQVELDLEAMATGIDGLYALPAGRGVPNPSEVLGSQKMREQLALFKTQFDIIVIDSPPVLAATDPVLLATQCDATVLVVKAGKTESQELALAQDALKNVGATTVGFLLNGFRPSMAPGYSTKYNYYQKYGYAYRSDEEVEKAV